MSNSKVRKQLEAIEAKTKKYSQYAKIETLLLNYQMCKAYFHDSGASIIGIAELILKEKYNLRITDKISNVINDIELVSNIISTIN